MNMEKAGLLAERGRIYLDREEFAKAEESFVLALAEAEDPVVRNNLAMTRFLLGKPQEALDALEGYETDWPNPYRMALVTQCLVALGKMAEARNKAAAAVRAFEKLAMLMKKDGMAGDKSWREYTVMVMRAAAAVEDHRLVLELYKRWQQYHVSWENKYLAGVAAFNLKRFKQAAAYWSGVRELPYASQLQLICVLAEHKVIPAFQLEYRYIDNKLLTEAQGRADANALLENSGVLRLMLLITVFDERVGDQETSPALDGLIMHGGQWGRDFGLELLEATMIPDNIKVMAAQSLVKAGVYAEGEEVPILLDGETRLVKVNRVEVTWEPGADVMEIYHKSLRLRDQGKREEAIELLMELSSRTVMFPPAMLVLSNLFRDMKKNDQARSLLETLERVAPDHPIILYNLSGFWLEQDDREKAKAYFDRIDASRTNDEFKMRMGWLKNAIEHGLESRMFRSEEIKRLESEEKKLPTNPTMARGLRNMPVQWVRSACDFWQVDCAYRKDGEAGLVKTAGSAQRVRESVIALPADERELLSYVLGKGGYVRVSAITRMFGSMEGDGFLVGNEPPRSPLGRLWIKALVFVGRARINGRNEKIAAIPVELREELQKTLEKYT